MKITLFTIFCLLCSGTVYCQLPLGRPSSPSKVVEKDDVKIEYFDSNIQISPISSITLEGVENSNLGLSLEVSFYIEGKKIKIPTEVSLVFYSNAKVARFPNQIARRVTLMDNQQKISSNLFILLTQGKEEKHIHESIGGELRYVDFKKFVQSKLSYLLLGKQKILLTETQLHPLRNMIKVIENQ